MFAQPILLFASQDISAQEFASTYQNKNSRGINEDILPDNINIVSLEEWDGKNVDSLIYSNY